MTMPDMGLMGPGTGFSDKTQAQMPNSGPDPIPSIPHTAMSKEGWQQYLQEKLHEHRAGSNPKAFLGIQKAVHALNQYEGQAIAPSTGELLGAEAKGVSEIPGQAARGISQLLEDLTSGQFNKAGKDVVGGLGQMAKGTLQLPSAALSAIGGSEVPERDELMRRAESYGSNAPMAALTVPSMIKPAMAGLKAAKGVGGGLANVAKLLQSIAGKAPEAAKAGAEAGSEAAEATGEAAQAGAAGASPAGSPRPTVRGGGQATPGYEGQPKGIDVTGVGPAAGKASTAPTLGDYTGANALQSVADAIRQQRPGIASLDEMVQRNAQPPQMDTGNLTNQPPQFEEGLPAARTSTMASSTPADIASYLKQIVQAQQQGYGPAPFKGGYR